MRARCDTLYHYAGIHLTKTSKAKPNKVVGTPLQLGLGKQIYFCLTFIDYFITKGLPGKALLCSIGFGLFYIGCHCCRPRPNHGARKRHPDLKQGRLGQPTEALGKIPQYSQGLPGLLFMAYLLRRSFRECTTFRTWADSRTLICTAMAALSFPFTCRYSINSHPQVRATFMTYDG